MVLTEPVKDVSPGIYSQPNPPIAQVAPTHLGKGTPPVKSAQTPIVFKWEPVNGVCKDWWWSRGTTKPVTQENSPHFGNTNENGNAKNSEKKQLGKHRWLKKVYYGLIAKKKRKKRLGPCFGSWGFCGVGVCVSFFWC